MMKIENDINELKYAYLNSDNMIFNIITFILLVLLISYLIIRFYKIKFKKD